ncbi:MAG TPA: LysE family translocator [Candidatus Eisenbacteria bacterium]|nr:LysE family translocator [Candidatus Eisenbacteria bacterium]
MIEHLPTFLAIAAVVIITPGPDTALTLRNTLIGGRRGGLATALGVVTGQTVWNVATSAGLAGLLIASRPLFGAIKLVGAFYLIYLGVHALIAAWKGAAPGEVAAPGATARASVAFRQGVFSNVANPKMAIFFTSLLPQFARPGDTAFVGLLALGLIFSTMTLVWLAGYVVVAARAGDVLRRRGVRRALEGVMGALLVAFGVRLATEER